VVACLSVAQAITADVGVIDVAVTPLNNRVGAPTVVKVLSDEVAVAPTLFVVTIE
jgi:hypothetical protein